jgi:8-oxo-dGTP pyrophosphatase MutT (NUDIX family)
MTFRATSRVLLFDPDDRVLMFLQYGKDTAVPPRWITPGGGVDPGEDHDAAAIREVHEETGLALDAVPAPFAETDFDPDQRWHPYDEGHWAWYALRVPAAFEPSRAGWTDEEQVEVVDWRWMGADELAAEHASAGAGGHEIEPADLPELVRTHVPPKEEDA